MHYFIKLILFGILINSQILFADATYTKPKFINNLNTQKTQQEYPGYGAEKRTFESFETEKKETSFKKNTELQVAYKNVNKPSFVILYNRLLDDKVSKPNDKITIESNYQVSQTITRKIYIPINSSENTLSKQELWYLEHNVMEYFDTNELKVVDRNFLMRIGDVVSKGNDSVREIEVKSLSKGADYLVEILFGYNKEYKIKVIKLENGQVVFSEFSLAKDIENKNYKKSKNNDFANIKKSNTFKDKFIESFENLSKRLIIHWQDNKESLQNASSRKAKQSEALGMPESSNSLGADKVIPKGKKGSGTGFFVSNDGYILTNSHVINNAKNITVEYKGNNLDAKLISEDTNNDIALIKIEIANAKPLNISADKVTKGAEVCALGFPLINLQGKELKSTFGNVNAVSGIEGDVRFYQVDTAIQPGNSGGPLINKKGEVVGIISSKLNQFATLKQANTFVQNVNYAIKIQYATPMLTQFGLNLSLNQEKNVELSGSELVDFVNDSIILIKSVW